MLLSSIRTLHSRSEPSRALRGMAIWLALPLALGAWASAAPSAGAKRPPETAKKAVPASLSRLDSTKIHQLYINGDFEEAVVLLEDNLKNDQKYSHDDSVFIFKHLGVMYAAEERTREKGRYYMHRLLLVEPTARILDMYASDMIYMIFKNIQEEFEASRERKVHADTTLGRSIATPPRPGDRPAREEPGKGSSKGIWVGATAAVVVAAGVASWFYFSDEPETSVQNHRPE